LIGICKIASYIPELRIDNIARKELFGVSETFLEEKVRIVRVARKKAEEESSDLCCRAFEKLAQKGNFNVDDFEVAVVCTQNPDYNLPHVSAILHDKIGLKGNCATFDISLGCSGYVYGLALIESFMRGMGLRRGLFFTADPYSKVLKENDKNTNLIFGDAATVTLVGEDPIFESMKFSFGTRGSGYKYLICNDGQLSMNGREVFNFAASVIPGDTKYVLAKNGLDIDDVDLFLFHQASKYIIDYLTKAIGIPKEKVPYVIAGYGNTVSSSIPLMLENILGDKMLETVLISGFGVGLSWASGILKRKK